MAREDVPEGQAAMLARRAAGEFRGDDEAYHATVDAARAERQPPSEPL